MELAEVREASTARCRTDDRHSLREAGSPRDSAGPNKGWPRFAESRPPHRRVRRNADQTRTDRPGKDRPGPVPEGLSAAHALFSGGRARPEGGEPCVVPEGGEPCAKPSSVWRSLKGVLASGPSAEEELRSQRVTEMSTHAGH